MSEPQIVFDITGPAVIFAALVGPLLAVWASEWRYSRRNKQEKRESVFRVLMSTRATRLNIAHVEALNQIDFVFDNNRHKQIRESWALYRKHLQSSESASTDQLQAVWQSKGTDLFSDLLYEILKGLSLSFDKSYIIENSYSPDAYLLAEIDNIKIRKLLLSGLENGVPIKVQDNNQ
jgi:hypothetical protein